MSTEEDVDMKSEKMDNNTNLGQERRKSFMDTFNDLIKEKRKSFITPDNLNKDRRKSTMDTDHLSKNRRKSFVDTLNDLKKNTIDVEEPERLKKKSVIEKEQEWMEAKKRRLLIEEISRVEDLARVKKLSVYEIEEEWQKNKKKSILEAQKDAKLFRMIISALIALLPGYSIGMVMSFSAPALINYKDPVRSPLDRPLNDEEGSWFMSIVYIADVTGILMSGILSDYLGRKRTLILSCSIIVLGWVLVYMSHTLELLLFSRFVSGLGMGVAMLCGYVFLSEISLIRLRGAFGVFNTCTINLATLTSFSLAAIVPFGYFIELSSVPAVLFLALSFFVPESPLWLVKKGKEDEARKALVILRGAKYELEAELEELIILAEEKEDTKLVEDLKYFFSVPVLKPVFLLGGLFFLQALSGTDCITSYSLDIFQKANLSINKYLLAIILQIVWTFTYALATYLMSRVRRRRQFLTSGLFLAPSLAILGVTLYFQTHDHPHPVLQYASPLLIVIVCVVYALGVGPILFALVGELFQPRVKGVSAAIALCTRYIGVFISLKLFPNLYHVVGLSGIFWINSFVASLAVILVFLYLPETQGLTLTEISSLFIGKPMSNSNIDSNNSNNNDEEMLHKKKTFDAPPFKMTEEFVE